MPVVTLLGSQQEPNCTRCPRGQNDTGGQLLRYTDTSSEKCCSQGKSRSRVVADSWAEVPVKIGWFGLELGKTTVIP